MPNTRGKLGLSRFFAGPDQSAAAFTLVELLIVIVLVGVMASLAIVASSSTATEHLRWAAKVVAAELDYARGLAIGTNSQYRVEFDVAGNRLMLRHSGADSTLDALPQTPFRRSDDPPDRQYLRLDELPGLATPVRLLGAQTKVAIAPQVGFMEFGPYGETAHHSDTIIWLTHGRGEAQRYIPVAVDHLTGLASVGDIQAAPPAGF